MRRQTPLWVLKPFTLGINKRAYTSSTHFHRPSILHVNNDTKSDLCKDLWDKVTKRKNPQINTAFHLLNNFIFCLKSWLELRDRKKKSELCYTHLLTQCCFSCIPALRNQFLCPFSHRRGAVTQSCHRGAIFPTRYDLCPSSSLSLPLTPSFTRVFSLSNSEELQSFHTNTNCNVT